MNKNATTADTASEDYLYGTLYKMERTLEDLFTWDHATKGFAWTGTTEQFDELQALRAEISNHPLIAAEAEQMMRAEARC